jgi:predicted NAD/FAD-binding protein
VRSLRRREDAVELTPANGPVETFDHVVVAAHADQALRMLADPSPAEREVLSAFPYRPNDTVLHTDTRVLPRRPLARASWNFHLLREQPEAPLVTYDMNRLQGLPCPERLLVTLNRTADLDPSKILGRWSYEHPSYSVAAVAAQARRDEVNGVRRTWYCGAWWGFGFHEDGLQSALAVTRRFGADL